MKLEVHMKQHLYSKDSVMHLLDAYLTHNPRVKDVRLLLGDDNACD
jgi:hypothetical protein